MILTSSYIMDSPNSTLKRRIQTNLEKAQAENELKGTSNIETYQKNKIQTAADVFQNIKKNNLGLIPEETPDKQSDLFEKIAHT